MQDAADKQGRDEYNAGVISLSAPGRTEISGNHTGHQHGCVQAASVDLKSTAAVILSDDNVIRGQSEGYAPAEVNLVRFEMPPVGRDLHSGVNAG